MDASNLSAGVTCRQIDALTALKIARDVYKVIKLLRFIPEL